MKKHLTITALGNTRPKPAQGATTVTERLISFLKRCRKNAKGKVAGAIIGGSMLFTKAREPPQEKYSVAIAPTDAGKAVMKSVVLNSQVLELRKTVISSRTRREHGIHVMELDFEDGSMIRARFRPDGIRSVTLRKDGTSTTISLDDAQSHINTGTMSGVSVSGPSGNDDPRFALRLPKAAEKSTVVFQMMNGDSVEIAGLAGSILVEYFPKR